MNRLPNVVWIVCFVMYTLMYRVQAQAVFNSNTTNGNWNSSGSWTLVSGSDANGIPDSNDDVTILSGDQINVRSNVQCDDIDIVGTLNFSRNNRTLTVNGNATMTGAAAEIAGDGASRTLNISGTLSVASGATATVEGITMTVTGTTTLDGSFSFLDITGTKTFGNIDVNASGSWVNNTVAEDFTVNGDIANDGTFTGCSDLVGCVYTFNDANGTFSGSGTITVTDMEISTGAAYTSTTTIVINDELTGNGSFTNGSGASLELQGGGPFDVNTFSAAAATNTVTYTGTGSEPVFAATYYNLVVNKTGGILDNDGTVTINNDLTVTLGTFDINAAMSVSGDVNVNGGLLEHNAATLNLTGNLNIGGGEYSPANTSAVANISGNFSMTSGTFDHNNGDLNISGDLLLSGGTMDFDGSSSTLDATDATLATATATWDAGTINISNAAGGLTVNSGSLTMNGSAVTISGTYDLNGGTNDLDGGSLAVEDMDIEGSDLFTVSNATLNHTGTMTVNGTLTFDNGNGSYTLNDLTVASGGNWNVTAASDFTFDGNISHNGASWTACSASACDYTLASTTGTIGGTSDITITDVIINSPASYTNNGSLLVTDRLTGTGSFINGTNATLDYSGNNSAGANFDITNFTTSATGNTVTYSRAGDQQLRTTTDADNNYHNVVISTTAAGNDVTLAGNITIDNQLTLTLGDLFLDVNRLTLADGATVSGGSANSYIGINSTGVLRQNYSAAGSTLAFPIGDAGDYSPITAFTINSATFGAGAYLEFDITDANHPNRNTSNTPTGDDDGTAAVDFISRYWTVSANNITAPDYDVDYVYVDLDITGTESNMVAAIYRLQPTLGILDWFETGSVNPTTNTVSLVNADAFGDLYAMNNTLQRLPIVLLSFEAAFVNGQVELNWATASEENNAFFTIERSTDGLDFEAVLTREGAGNSKTELEYHATDVNPPAGRVFYRLKQTDFNGMFEYSELVSVDVEVSGDPIDFTIKGNVISAGDLVTISRSKTGEAALSLKGVNGQSSIIIQVAEVEGRDVEVRLPGALKKGLYVLQLVQSGEKISRKLLVQ